MSTKWTCKTNPCTITIDLQKISLIDRVELKWENEIQGCQKISYKVADEHTAEKSGRFRNVVLFGVGSRVEVVLSGNDRYDLLEIVVSGTSYYVKEILKMKVELAIQGNEQGINTLSV